MMLMLRHDKKKTLQYIYILFRYSDVEINHVVHLFIYTFCEKP